MKRRVINLTQPSQNDHLLLREEKMGEAQNDTINLAQAKDHSNPKIDHLQFFKKHALIDPRSDQFCDTHVIEKYTDVNRRNAAKHVEKGENHLTLTALKLTIRKKRSMSFPLENGSTPLIELIKLSNNDKSEDDKVLSYASVYMPNIDKKDALGLTPLMYATKKGYIKTINFILLLTDNIDAQDTLGHTALMYAARMSNRRVISMLLDEGASTQILTKFRLSVFNMTRDESIKSLLESKDHESEEAENNLSSDKESKKNACACM